MTGQLLEKENVPLAAGEDDVRRYIHEIRQYPRLTPQEERELARRCAEGDEDAVRRMVNSNLRLVVSIAREYTGRGVPLLDLVQEGSVGLLAAARRFDYTLDFRLSTYATKWIRQSINQCIIDHTAMIRVPQHTAERMRKLTVAKTVLLQEMGREATVAELARYCGETEEKALELLRQIPEVCSLDIPTGDAEDSTLAALIEDVNAPQPQEALIRQELRHIMDELLGKLNDRQRLLVRLRFGMEDGNCYSREEIGRKLGISKERVRQIEQQAMEKLKNYGADMGLEDFLQ